MDRTMSCKNMNCPFCGACHTETATDLPAESCTVIHRLRKQVDDLEQNVLDAERYLGIEQNESLFWERLARCLAAKYGEDLDKRLQADDFAEFCDNSPVDPAEHILN